MTTYLLCTRTDSQKWTAIAKHTCDNRSLGYAIGVFDSAGFETRDRNFKVDTSDQFESQKNFAGYSKDVVNI